MIEIIIIVVLIIEFITLDKKYNSKKTLILRIISLASAVAICLIVWLTTKMMSLGSLLTIVVAVPILLAVSIVRYYKNSGSGSGDPLKNMLRIIRNNFRYLGEKNSQDTEKLCELLSENKIIQYINIEKSKNLPQSLADAIEMAKNENSQRKNMAESFITDLNDFAEKHSLKYAVIKGIAFDKRIYDGAAKRSFGDIDLLINEADAEHFHKFLLEKGYSQHVGLTSIPKSNTTRAVMAFNASIHKKENPVSQPVKAISKMPEYSPYWCSEKLPVELHTGIYYLDNRYISEMLENTVLPDAETTYKMLNLADTFIVLLLTAYENSESTAVNLYDSGMNIRDYVDIRNFFVKYKKVNIWDDVTEKIKRYGIEKYAEIVLYNLKEIYEEDITEGCFYSLTMRRSEWGMSLTDRMSDPEKTEKNTLKILRNHWDGESRGNLFYVIGAGGGEDLINTELKLKKDVSFRIERSNEAFTLNWSIPAAIYAQAEQFLFQCRFYPLGEEVQYAVYKVDFGYYGDERKAYGRKTIRLRDEAVKKENGTKLNFLAENFSSPVRVKIEIPYSEFEISQNMISGKICMDVGVYEKYYGEIYRLSGEVTKLAKYKVIVG